MCSPATGNGRPRQSPRSRCRRATVCCGVSDTSFDTFNCCAAGVGGSKSCLAASSSLPTERSAASKRLVRGSGNRHSCNPRVAARQSESSPPRSRSPGRKLAGRSGRPRVMGADERKATLCRDSPDRARSTAKHTTEAATRQGMRCLHSRAPGMICPARAMRLRLQVNANRPLSLPTWLPWCLRLAGTP